MKVAYYTLKGNKKKDKISAPDALFKNSFNPDLIHQAVRVYQLRQRQPAAHVKDRSEVSGSGRKPWPQKGTGRARHGSRRSPLWVGGGVVFGPRRGRRFKKKLPQKMKRKALISALSEKYRQGEIFFVDEFKLSSPKTKQFFEAVSRFLGKVKGLTPPQVSAHSLALVVDQRDPELFRASRNLPKIDVLLASQLNTLKVLKYKFLIITEPALKLLEKFYENQDK